MMHIRLKKTFHVSSYLGEASNTEPGQGSCNFTVSAKRIGVICKYTWINSLIFVFFYFSVRTVSKLLFLFRKILLVSLV